MSVHRPFLRHEGLRRLTLALVRSIAIIGVYCLIGLYSSTSAHAEKSNEGASLLAGLRPASDASLDGLELSRVRESQELRQTIRGVVELLSGRTVESHDTLRSVLGPGYLVSQFDCGNDRRCLVQLFKPLVKRGFEDVILGAYFVDGDDLTIRIDIFALKSGDVVATTTATVPLAEFGKPDTWVGPLTPLFTNVGQVQLRSNITEFECVVDGSPCVLDEDLLLSLKPGDHIVELSKEGYVSGTSTVTVVKGQTTPLAIALTELPKLADYLEAGQINVRELLKRDKSISLNGRTFQVYSFNENNISQGGALNAPFFGISFSSKKDALSFALDYNFYASENWTRFVWVGLQINKSLSARVGLIPVDPALRFFGDWPEESMAYHMGFDDDHDNGLDLTYEGKRLGLQFAYLINDEFANGGQFSRYTGDIATFNGQAYSERHQGTLKATYLLGDDNRNVRVGGTGSAGLIRNDTDDSYGTRWSLAGHAVAKWDDLIAKAQVIGYEYAPSAGVDEMGNPIDTSTIGLSYFSTLFEVAAKGTWLESALFYDVPIKKDVITRLRFFGGYSQLLKSGGLPRSTQLTLGGRVDFSNLLVFLDGQASKNAPDRGDGGVNGLAGGVGGGNAQWFMSANLILLYTFEM